jgi:hypothetical protein
VGGRCCVVGLSSGSAPLRGEPIGARGCNLSGRIGEGLVEDCFGPSVRLLLRPQLSRAVERAADQRLNTPVVLYRLLSKTDWMNVNPTDDI